MVGVFGGSGFTSLLERVEQVTIDTPYGPTSAPFAVGELEGRKVAFMPRHGLRHELPPAQIPYRANVWAMRELGVRRIVGPAACGSLRVDLEPGDFVVCDQFVDRTSGRSDTFYEGPETTHVAAAEPFCPGLRGLLVATARELGIPVHDGGTAVVIQGPRFSTRAESEWYAAQGWDVVNMTAYPEAWLARELELCYANVSMITDYDAGAGGHEPVSADAVVRVFGENLEKLQALLFAAIPRIEPQPDDVCASALTGARL